MSPQQENRRCSQPSPWRAVQAGGSPPAPDAADDALINSAFLAIQAGSPAQAVATLDPLITRLDTAAAADPRRRYCAMSPTESLAYMMKAAGEKRSAVAVGLAHCKALFLRGYALVDLGRLADARAAYQRAMAMAPMHAHFLTEFGQTYRLEKNWPDMLATCRRAADLAPLDVPAERTRQQTAAWRCMGYALVEQRQWTQARALYDKCLALDPADDKSRGELRYIDEQQPKPTT